MINNNVAERNMDKIRNLSEIRILSGNDHSVFKADDIADYDTSFKNELIILFNSGKLMHFYNVQYVIITKGQESLSCNNY